MKFDINSHIAALFRSALESIAPESAGTPILLERPKQADHGDLACNIALQLAKKLKTNPRQFAERLVVALRSQPAFAEHVDAVEIAGAGFVNLRLSAKTKQAIVAAILAEGAAFGRGASTGCKIQVEFVSANPTGPLHVGHGRGAAYGACVSNLLAFAGNEVQREFYINDAGRQMDILAVSVWLRYLELLGERTAFPEDGYRADYVRSIAQTLVNAHSSRFKHDASLLPDTAYSEDADAALDALIAGSKSLLGESWWELHGHALEAMLADQKNDLGEFGVTYDRWFSEQSLFDSGEIERAVARLGERGQLHEKDGALWFKSTAFGDEKDRVVRRENGQLTYFASDIAYHLNKFERGFDRLINVWGADHHGYIPRVTGAMTALGLDADRLEIALVQFAVLYRQGEKVAMGKRSGDFVTLRDLRNEVGNDAARFFYVLRKSDQHLDFDLDLAKSQSNENPVYYVQYAHARVCSVFAQRGGDARDPKEFEAAATHLLSNPRELTLMQRLAEFPEVVQSAARELAPHSLAFYLRDLAADFHSYYNAERILVEDALLANARLALCAATRHVLASGLALLGVGAPERM